MSRQCAVEMGDTKIMSYDGDIISRDDIYYHKCMTGFTNSHRSSWNRKDARKKLSLKF